MSVEIKQSELRNDNAVIMRRVSQGESFVVTVNGRPVADVVPHRHETGRRQFVPAIDAVAALNHTPLSASDTQRWRQDVRANDDLPDDPWTRRGGAR